LRRRRAFDVLARDMSAAAEVIVPGKPRAAFRVYDETSERHDGVREHYKQMRSNQSLAFSRAQTAKWRGSWGQRVGGRMTVRDALLKCDSFVDRSDPDTALPNSVHMLQAAEAARLAGKPDWFILCALVHDIGKLMCVVDERRAARKSLPRPLTRESAWRAPRPLRPPLSGTSGARPPRAWAGRRTSRSGRSAVTRGWWARRCPRAPCTRT